MSALERVLIFINDLMAGAGVGALAGCFAWGLVSVLLSPCHAASVLVLISYISAQGEKLSAGRAARFAVAFSAGLFLIIAALGAACAALGRMLGDVPGWLEALAGLAMILMAISLMRRRTCVIAGSKLLNLNLRGLSGALILGGLYGVVSGVCTFGFLAPVLGVIFVERRVAAGVAMAVCFAAGHCLPIALAGGLTGLINSSVYQKYSGVMIKLACGVIVLAGVYFMANGLLSS